VPLRRISDLNAALHTGSDPSDVVPGVAAGGRASRPCPSCGGDDGPDGVFSLSFRDLFALFEDHVVFSIYFGVLNVICTAE
jgi:hypothetical protein